MAIEERKHIEKVARHLKDLRTVGRVQVGQHKHWRRRKSLTWQRCGWLQRSSAHSSVQSGAQRGRARDAILRLQGHGVSRKHHRSWLLATPLRRIGFARGARCSTLVQPSQQVAVPSRSSSPLLTPLQFKAWLLPGQSDTLLSLPLIAATPR